MADCLLLFISGLILFLSPGAYGQITKTISVPSVTDANGTIKIELPERVSLTQPFNVSFGIGGYINVLQNKNIYLNVSTSDVRITASYDEHSFVVKDLNKNISVRFDLSPDVPLLEKQVKVNVSVSFDKNQSTSAIVELIEGRAGIGFHPSFQQRPSCYPNSSCDLALTIKMSSTISTFDVTLTLLNSTNHKVNKVSFPVNRENTNYHIQVTAPTVGVFTAMLTVADDMTNMVYWIQQNLTVTVEENPLKLELNSLTEKFKQLSAKYDTLMLNYTTLSTKLENIFDRFGDGFGEYLCANVECGEYGDCESGKCICKYPDVFSGANCDEFVGCEGKPCGNRGNCSQPADIDDKFECTCHDENVTGKDCSVCNSTVSCNGRGNCSVNIDNGQPSCNCSAHYGGDNCNVCAAGWTGDNCELKLCTKKELLCGDHGDCYYVNGTNVTQCYCEDGYKGTECKVCAAGWTGDNCELKLCTKKELECGDHGYCYYVNGINEAQCYCEDGYKGTKCKDDGSVMDIASSVPATPPKITTPTDPPAVSSEDQDDGNSNLLYGGLIIFIAVLVVCVVAYLAYHNKDKIIDLLGWKKESVVEMAMRSRTKKSKGYQKLPTSIHDTVTHED